MNNGPEDTKFEKDDALADAQLEAALRKALAPEQAPMGFADRVMARALAGDLPTAVAASRPVNGGAAKGNLLSWPQRRLWISGAIAAALVAGIFEGEIALRRVREQEQRVVQATQEFQTTERITVQALEQARAQLQRAGVPLTLQ